MIAVAAFAAGVTGPTGVSVEALVVGVAALLAALFGSAGIGGVIQGRRAVREGVSANAAQARADESRRQAESDARTERELRRLAESLQTALDEIDELREEQRAAFVREQQQRTVLMYHGAWDFAVRQELQRLGADMHDPPPLWVPPTPEDDAREARGG